MITVAVADLAVFSLFSHFALAGSSAYRNVGNFRITELDVLDLDEAS